MYALADIEPAVPGQMNVKVNGEHRAVAEAMTISALLDELRIPPEHVAVEVNAQIVRRARYAEVKLAPGDEIEIVTFVGGG